MRPNPLRVMEEFLTSLLTMADWLLVMHARHEARDRHAGDIAQQVIEREGPKYPDCELMFDLGGTFNKRIAFYLQHEVGIGIYYVYYYPQTGRVDTHAVYSDDEKFSRMIGQLRAAPGFVKPDRKVVERDVLAFLRRPAPSRSP